MDLTKKKPNGNDMVKVKVHDQKTNQKQQKKVTNMTQNNTIMAKGQLKSTTTPATDDQLKKTTGKAVVYQVMTPQGRQYLTNIHTRHLGKSIIPQKTSTPTTDTQKRQQQETIVRNHMQQQQQMRATEMLRLNQSQATRQQQQQMILKQQSQQAVTANFRQIMTKKMPTLNPRLQHQAQYITNTLIQATAQATRDNTIEENGHLTIAMGGLPTLVPQPPVITIDEQSETDVEGAQLLMDLHSSGNKKHIPATITSAEVEENKQTTEVVPTPPKPKPIFLDGVIMKHEITDPESKSKTYMTTYHKNAKLVAQAHEQEYHREIIGLNNPNYMVHNQTLNAWLKCSSIIINFKGVLEYTIFKPKNQNVRETLPFLKRCGPKVQPGNQLILIKNREILDQDRTWESNGVRNEDNIYVAISTNWRVNMTNEEIPAISYKLDMMTTPPQPSTSGTSANIRQNQQKRSKEYMIFEMDQVPKREREKFKNSLQLQVQVMENLPEEEK